MVISSEVKFKYLVVGKLMHDLMLGKFGENVGLESLVP